MQIKTLEDDIRLYLEPRDCSILAGTHTPIWVAESNKSSPLGIQYTKIDFVRLIKILFRDFTYFYFLVIMPELINQIKIYEISG